MNEKYKEQTASEAEAVRQAGGLYIIGTERHESRRIDNQLRGRAGRQGDPGESRFYISLEGDLMRLFGGERISMMMERMNIDEDMPIENGMLTNSIESAQRKVEGRNFAIRKNVLQYDDVMNRQREIIYTQRDQVLNGDNMKPQILNMVEKSIEENVARYLPANSSHDAWDMNGLHEHYAGWLIRPEEFQYTENEMEDLDPAYLTTQLKKRALSLYEEREKAFGGPIMRELEHVILLKNVDSSGWSISTQWKN